MKSLVIHYTGAQSLNYAQTDPNKSLGGYKSSSPMPNGINGNLFSEVSYKSEHEGIKECRGVTLTNDGNEELTTVQVYFDWDTAPTKTKWYVAVVTLDANFAMKKIQYPQEIPVGVTFVEATTTNKVSVAASLPVGSSVGLWVQREVISLDDQTEVTCSELESYLENAPKEEVVKLSFDFD